MTVQNKFINIGYIYFTCLIPRRYFDPPFSMRILSQALPAEFSVLLPRVSSRARLMTWTQTKAPGYEVAPARILPVANQAPIKLRACHAG